MAVLAAGTGADIGKLFFYVCIFPTSTQGRRFMPIYLVWPGLRRKLCLLTELSLPGVPLPLASAVPSFYSLPCEAVKPQWRLKLN